MNAMNPPGFRHTFFMSLLAITAGMLQAQTPTPNVPTTAAPEVTEKRILGIIPNFRSSAGLTEYKPLSVKDKFRIARDDSFDRGTVVLGMIFGAEAQLTSANPSFGQGIKGYSQYAATGYGDYLIGNMMTEGVFPSLLHQDPRFFRQGTGSSWSRLGHSVKQIFWTRKDSGGYEFNFSEFGGNAASVAISNAYYVDNRTVGDNVSKLGTQIAVDMAGNILKEFGPDVMRKFSRKRPKN